MGIQEKKASRQYYGIDLMKFFMAFGMIMGHTMPLTHHETAWIAAVYNYTVNLAVPFFFISSSYFLYRKFDADFLSERNVALVRSTLLRFIRMYLVWHLIYLPISIYGAVRTGNSLIKCLLRFAVNLVCVGEQWYSWPLWYLLSTIYALTLTYVLMKCRIKEKGVIILSLLFFGFAEWMDWFVQHRAELDGIMGLASYVCFETFASGRVFTGIGCMALGMLRARSAYRPRYLLCAGIFAAGLVVSLLGICVADTLLIMGFAYVLYDAVSYFQTDKPGFNFGFFRRASTVLYFVHMIWYFLGGCLLWGFEEPWCYGLLPYTVALSMSLAAAFAVEKLWKYKAVRFIFS